MNGLISSAWLAVLLLFAGLPSVRVALVSYTITDNVLVGFESFYNAYCLYAGDTVTVYGVFDDSSLSAATGVIDFDTLNRNSMTIMAGSQVLYAFHDLLLAIWQRYTGTICLG